ncbi:RNA polymerase sigma factor [Hallella absiana]|uniref:RNA polymerase sigma factor n=1 Tax=Hallella absiana TaxID=2925336 RepID=UPI0021C91DA4|nr:RNA polymerase sigma factor [Hallella absiana]
MKVIDKEQQIAEAFRRGETSAMDDLFALFSGYLMGVGIRYIADDDEVKDVLQEAFIKIFTQFHTFQYRGKGSLKAWVTRIMVNECLTTLRQKQKIDVVDGEQVPDLSDEEPDTEGLDGNVLMEMIRRLPEGYRQVLNLYVVEGLSHKEIGQMLHIKPDSSASQLHRAKAMLAKMINDYKRRLR